MKTIKELYTEIIDTLDNIDYHDSYENGSIEKVMEYFCSNYDKGYGMAEAIKLTLIDQYNNHQEDLTTEELEELLRAL